MDVKLVVLKNKKIVIALVVVFITISSIAVHSILENNLKDDIKGNSISAQESVSIEIPDGFGTSAISMILYKNKIIKMPLVFRVFSKFRNCDGKYKSGVHVLKKNLSYNEIMDTLCEIPPNRSDIKITIPEGLMYNQIFEILSQKFNITQDVIDKVTGVDRQKYRFLANLPDRENILEGYLFPDTYEFDEKVSQEEIIKRFLENFDSKFKEDYYGRASNLNMSIDQIVTLASIIEKEAVKDDERKKISRVFYNRLNNKIPYLRKLQSCATLNYIFLKQNGKTKTRVTQYDTKIENPYNTYINEGLPPGPICSPGIASIEAALYPEENNYLYFVAKGDGSHEFSTTLEEHNIAARKYGVY